MDGIVNTDLRGAIYGFLPIIDAMQEFKVASHIDDAQYGVVTGGVVNMLSRSGTNSFHGSVWESTATTFLTRGTPSATSARLDGALRAHRPHTLRRPGITCKMNSGSGRWTDLEEQSIFLWCISGLALQQAGALADAGTDRAGTERRFFRQLLSVLSARHLQPFFDELRRQQMHRTAFSVRYGRQSVTPTATARRPGERRV